MPLCQSFGFFPGVGWALHAARHGLMYFGPGPWLCSLVPANMPSPGTGTLYLRQQKSSLPYFGSSIRTRLKFAQTSFFQTLETDTFPCRDVKFILSEFL